MFRPAVLLGMLLIACLAAGCGGSSGYHMSGNATFNGKPIPVGRIYFMPDGSKGNTGAASSADIKDGKYDTSAGGQGAVGGPMIVKIEGFDGVKTDEDRPSGNPLFAFYETPFDMPKGSSTKDFDVPASAVSAQPPTAPQIVVP